MTESAERVEGIDEWHKIGPKTSCLDGDFSAEELILIAAAMMRLRREQEAASPAVGTG